MSKIAISLTVNGERQQLLAEPREQLVDLLRRDLMLTGTHVGCEHGVCGACTVEIDGAPARSCIIARYFSAPLRPSQKVAADMPMTM